MSLSNLRIGLQVPMVNTFTGAVWGDEVMAVGLAEALMRQPEVGWAEVYDPVTVHDNLDLLIHFYPHPECRYVPGPYNVWWFQAPWLHPVSDEEVRLATTLYDAYFAASPTLIGWLQQQGVGNGHSAAPLFLPMSVDPAAYAPQEPRPEFAHEIVFCANHNRSPEEIERYLLPLMGWHGGPPLLTLYGTGWEKVPELAPACRGPLHPRDVPALYSSAKLVLSVHGAWHRAMDVPTSRLWEAAACGAAVLSDPLPTAQALFEDTILWSEGGDDLRRQAEYYLAHEEERRSRAARARQLVLSRYTFDHHARRILHYLGVSGE